VNIYWLLKYVWTELVSKDVLTLLFAGLSVLFAALAVLFGYLALRVGRITLTYMRGRDLELDTRNGWIEIHKAMVNLRVQRMLVMLPDVMAALGVPAPIKSADSIKDYTLGAAQLRGQLERLNDDPLVVEITKFLEDNKSTTDWQSDKFQPRFDEFAHSVAMKSRPK
jgi:hypothetical protein